ncbi:MAG: nucleotidyl transferase AbiEii/AbiGii toxin family protein [Elusimicrobiota bacterium]
MIEALKQETAAGVSPEEKGNRAREFLQILALKSLSDQGAFSNVAFIGGTALRVLYGVRRFSEDLDFSITNLKGYDFKGLCGGLERTFRLNGLTVKLDKENKKTVNSVFLSFPGLPKALGLSGHKEEKLSIKIEVDTNPPAGWQTQRAIVNKTYLFDILHYDLSSMFAGKLHACFYRKFTKGRDIYDLFWYLGRKSRPNLVMLNNAIAQSQGKSPGITERNLTEFMLNGIARVDLSAAKKDVEKFLEDKSELKLFNAELLAAAIKSL